MCNQASTLLAFYDHNGHDHKGRTLEDVWALSAFWLEHTHDYIQWLFPLPEVGRFTNFAPLLGEAERAAFAHNEILRINQRHSLDIMIAFLGLLRAGDVITALPELNMREYIWLKRSGHNHLRITRMIRSLYLCHQVPMARALQKAVIDIGASKGSVSDQSLSYWQEAIS